ncbi:MAG: hypothetical protein ACTSRR_06725 [Candidatus Heimdallarchaeaceae archaeon]
MWGRTYYLSNLWEEYSETKIDLEVNIKEPTIHTNIEGEKLLIEIESEREIYLTKLHYRYLNSTSWQTISYYGIIEIQQDFGYIDKPVEISIETWNEGLTNNYAKIEQLIISPSVNEEKQVVNYVLPVVFVSLGIGSILGGVYIVRIRDKRGLLKLLKGVKRE